MNTGSSYRQFFMIKYVIIIIIVQLACNIPVQQTFNPPDESNNLAATKAPDVVTEDPPAQVDTPTNSPSAVPTKTRTPIPTVTLTPLPALPDFDRVLTFGGGGAGPQCLPYTDPVYSFIGDPSYFITGNLSLCIVLAATDYDKDFFIEVTGPDGKVYSSNSIFISQFAQTMYWDGYQGFAGNYPFLEESGNLYIEFYLSWRPNFLEGEWRIRILGHGNNLDLIDNTMVAKPFGRSYIAAASAGYGGEIIPSTSDSHHRPVRLTDDGMIGVIGSDFPPNTEVYVLLYRTGNAADAELLEKLSVVSDSAGFIETEISTSFEFGQTYYLIGINDPDTPLDNCVIGACDYASDLFEIIP